MKGPLGLDPSQCSCGPATPAVRQLLTEWAAIDWFEPASPTAASEASRAFQEHHRRARTQQPELFPDPLAITVQQGSWPELTELCERVRMQRWDWKFGALKQLSHRHSQAHGWSLGAEIEALQLPEYPQIGPGDLFFRFGPSVIWADFGPTLNLKHLDSTYAADALWYLSYARMDLIEATEWQLAERNANLDDNPFVPLLRCYTLGFYPFSLTRNQVLLFGFAEPA